MIPHLSLAEVSPDKLEEDKFIMNGIASMCCYLSDEEQNTTKCFLHEGVLYFSGSGEIVPDGRYMYVILPKGDLCVGSLTVHSQFNAGQPVISAGWLAVESSAIVCIDNNSGHYTPTLRQFLSGIITLHKEGLLIDKVEIQLNVCTTNDINFCSDFFDRLLEGNDQENLKHVDFIDENKIAITNGERFIIDIARLIGGEEPAKLSRRPALSVLSTNNSSIQHGDAAKAKSQAGTIAFR